MDRSDSKQVLLIADADSDSVASLEAILKPEFGVKVAGDRGEVIRLASSSGAPALILLNDLGPTADKYEVCRALKSDKSTRHIPIILIAEATADASPSKVFESGAADYIGKPYHKAVVRARVRAHLELSRYRDNLESKVIKRVSELHGELHQEMQQRIDIEDSYRTLVKHAIVGIVVIHDFIVKFANLAFCKMIGYSEEELTGAHLKKFISEEQFVKNTTRYSNRIKGLNLPRIYKSQVIHSDGSTIDVELNISVVPYGRTLAALVFVRDMREEEAWQYSI